MELKRLKEEIMEKAGEVMEYGHPTRFAVETPQGEIEVFVKVGENDVYIWVMRCEREDECDPCLWDEAFPDLAAAAAMFWRP